MIPSVTPPDSMSLNGLFRQFREAFERLTGLPLDILSPGEYRIPERAPEFCRILGLAGRSCASCHEAHAQLQGGVGGETRTAECFAGMTSSSVPVRSNGKTLAFLHTGHVFLGAPGPARRERMRRFAESLGLDREAFDRALEAARTADPGQYEAAVQLLEIFAGQLSEALPRRPLEDGYPAVEKALRMMRADLEQDWTLARVARGLKINASYLSDMFRKSTGKTFTAWLAGMRVERACRLLESTRMGIGEVAFAAGFRSISQFNRSFKALAGSSPGAYRQRASRVRPWIDGRA